MGAIKTKKAPLIFQKIQKLDLISASLKISSAFNIVVL